MCRLLYWILRFKLSQVLAHRSIDLLGFVQLFSRDATLLGSVCLDENRLTRSDFFNTHRPMHSLTVLPRTTSVSACRISNEKRACRQEWILDSRQIAEALFQQQFWKRALP
jgi:hypothetical protein